MFFLDGRILGGLVSPKYVWDHSEKSDFIMDSEGYKGRGLRYLEKNTYQAFKNEKIYQ